MDSEAFFGKVAHWARIGAAHAKDALCALAALSPEALRAAMKNCPDQIFLLEAWESLPEPERSRHRPDFQSFFAAASAEDSLAGIRILASFDDPGNLACAADLAFSSKNEVVRKAALELSRKLILAS